MAASQPIVISTTPVTFGATVSQQSPTQKLRNEDSVGVNIDRIVLSGGLHQSALVNMRLRNQPLTNGFIPWLSVAWPANPGNEGSASVLMLTKPVYLAPGDFIDISFRNDLRIGASSVVAAAFGKQATPAERSLYLPYLAAFQTATYDGTSNAAIDEKSTPQDLGNPFNEEIVASHFVGRVLSGAAADGLIVNTGFVTQWDYFNVRLADDRDRFLIPKFVPLSLAVDAEDYVWQVNTPLAPRGYYKFEVQGAASWGNPAAPYARAMFGMQGYRRIG